MSMSTPSRSNNNTSLSLFRADSAVRGSSASGDRAGLSLLCCLPDGLLRQKLLPFLKVEELVQLDSATCICVPAQRARLLSELAGTVLGVVGGAGSFHLHSASLGWLLRRRVGVRSAAFSDVYGDSAIGRCVENFGVEIARVVLDPLEYLEVFSTGAIFDKMLQHCKNLRSFEHRGGPWPERGEESCRSALAAVAKHCTGLQSLVVNNPPVSLAVVMEVAQSNPGLTVLNMTCATCTITEAEMVALSQQCRGLTEVGFPLDTTFAAASAAIVAQNWPCMQKLDLTFCYNVTDEWVAAFSQHCRGLREFHGYNFVGSGAAIKALARNCPELRVVDVQMALGVSDEGVAELSRCAGLESLNIRWCFGVTDVSIVAIAQHCRGLHKVYLGRNDGVTDASLHALSLHCRTLDTLHLHKSKGVTEGALVTLAQRLPGLTDLTVYHFPATTDALILAVAQNCAGMKSLTLDGCGAVTEASIDLLVQNCRALESLRVTGLLEPQGQLTIDVSEEWARALPQACSQLLRYFLIGRYSWRYGPFKVTAADDRRYADDDPSDHSDEDWDDDDAGEDNLDAEVDGDFGDVEDEDEGDEDQDEDGDNM
ncbi:hypothetical protein B484DRAFT_455657 [Ochromonadaceae sp. CCMP2298]|nr:hypothetical protein B484DRAFT_455657 [Ochromonadaceae sp. CCMP2298]